MPLSTEQQFLKFYDELAEAIFRHCYFRLTNRELAKDLMQEAFKKTWEYLAGGGEIQNFKAFIYRTTNNLIVDYARKKKTESLDKLREKGFDPGLDNKRSMENVIEGGRLLAVLNHSEIQHGDLIALRYIDDLTPKEISEITGESENNVSVKLHRALKKMRKILNYHDYGK